MLSFHSAPFFLHREFVVRVNGYSSGGKKNGFWRTANHLLRLIPWKSSAVAKQSVRAGTRPEIPRLCELSRSLRSALPFLAVGSFFLPSLVRKGVIEGRMSCWRIFISWFKLFNESLNYTRSTRSKFKSNFRSIIIFTSWISYDKGTL
jgi:hypothetical protein